MSGYKPVLYKVCALFLIFTFLSSGASYAGISQPAASSSNVAELQALAPAEPILTRDLLAKAAPDECYDGIGVPYPPGPPCEQGVPKVNQAYVWGLAKAGENLWFGTAPNVHCQVFGGFLGVVTPHETESWVCEFAESQYSPPLPETIGDWRPPHIYMYDLFTRTLTEKSPLDPRFRSTAGLRSAGTLGGVVILAGPSLTGGLNMFAYDAASGVYLGSANLPEYNNIRKWLVVNGVLYTAVRNIDGGGNVLRWRGDISDPFQFEVVGNLASEGAELALHDGRLFVSTWPYLAVTPVRLAGIFMSPTIPEGGLSADHADDWLKVWQSSDYEPDPVTAATYGGGALASFDGYLYWGTMHVPFLAAIAHFNVYGTPETQAGVLAGILGSHRAIGIFRGRDFGTENEQIELLYGDTWLPVYEYDLATSTGSWTVARNNMLVSPLWGSAGFGNFYNNYTWTMAVFEGQLYVGTMDYSYLFEEGVLLLLEYLLGIPPETNLELQFPLPLNPGADLYRFPSAAVPAVAESLDGVGNYSNYGIRTMIAADDLFLGSANPMNLMTDLTDDLPEGGWELIRLFADKPVYLPMVIH
ncbi:MAG TPA: hypothetical protein VLA49_03545 [Anaerolineales bacterium]|nr:hypothetical protein [Anaerolineales bacterium]